ncbi:amino acid permease [Oleiagrimonas sp. MCCC 1A03011]|uniref:amino acid permease n=1 Tax=Oleiagrimonas sp. MCCC 1A03011 TaxID=1926883 RepID=UPI000DC5FFA1|nr:amino acid permease [Oleiagrimonas sp. MCCC 1A03011]RAP56348.1 amino acid permease [Oleiagrimonas sp. MCCC 1A03011]
MSVLHQLFARKTSFRDDDDTHGPGLRRTLGPWGITALGIGAVIGTGIFVVTGTAAAEHAGPAVLISFILAAICSGFSALCYAEFATLIPISGSSYSYAYATLGEIVAWFIGWNMVLEYGISASAVATSWTGYFSSMLHDFFGIQLPAALTNAPLAFTDGHLVSTGALFNLPAVAIVLALTWLCYIGIRESSGLNAFMVVLKVGLILAIIVAGARYVDTSHWHPFIPESQGHDKYGWSGIFRGAAMVFFAYIGFEATSTAAQECKNPQRDLPFGIIVSLVLCTLLYLGMAAVMTGLVPYSVLDTADPVITAIRGHSELNWLRPLVEVGALIGLSSVILVMIIAQPRIFMIMARDGMLPKVFAKVHPRYRTPHINTLITGFGIAALAAIFPLDLLADLTSMGTLIAFTAVCAGVLILRYTQPDLPRTFRVPWAFVICIAGVLSCLFLLAQMNWFNWALMGIWTVIGLGIYFGFGYRHSLLRRPAATSEQP